MEQGFIEFLASLLKKSLFISSAAGLAIELSTLFSNFMRKGGGQMPVAVKFGPGVDQHVFGKTNSAQASLGALHSADRAFIAGGHDDHQVHIAVFGGRAPSVRAEEPDLFGLKFRFQSFDRLFQKATLNCLHAAKTSTLAPYWEAGITRTNVGLARGQTRRLISR